MIASLRKTLVHTVTFLIEDPVAIKDEYGLTPEGDWEAVYNAAAFIHTQGSNERLSDKQQVATNRWVVIIEPPKYVTIPVDTRCEFSRNGEGSTRSGVVESVQELYDRHGFLDRLRFVVRETK